MKQLLKIIPVLLAVLVQSCVGTDLVDDPVIPAKLTMLPRIDSLSVGQEQVFSVKYTNKFGIEAASGNLTWSSSHPERIAINASGNAKALTSGSATLYVTNETLTDSIVLNRLSGSNNPNNPGNSDTSFLKQGVFMPVTNHYTAKGTVYVQTVNGVSQIRTDANFGTSAGPSVYLLLTNHTNGSYSVTPGNYAISAVSAQITANKLTSFSGVQTWNIPPGVHPADYKYAVLYCVLGPIFGIAELQ